jgi:pimeloyl-ACP methyl ester carboxylesterase
MTEGFLESRGIAYRANEFRDGRPTLVFIHGLSGSASIWLPYEEYFGSRYNVITLDLRGHGKSKKYWRFKKYRIETFAEDVETLLEYLSVKNCVLVSHSLGSIIALAFIKKHPTRVLKAVFINPALGTNRLFFDHIKHPERMAVVLAAYLLASLNFPRRGQRTDYVRYRQTNDWNFRRAFADISRMGPLSYLFSLSHIYGFDDSKWWPAVTMPMLVIHGTNDTMVPVKYAIALSKKMLLQLVLIPKNHMLPMNSIGALSQAIEDFIK